MYRKIFREYVQRPAKGKKLRTFQQQVRSSECSVVSSETSKTRRSEASVFFNDFKLARRQRVDFQRARVSAELSIEVHRPRSRAAWPAADDRSVVLMSTVSIT